MEKKKKSSYVPEHTKDKIDQTAEIVVQTAETAETIA